MRSKTSIIFVLCLLTVVPGPVIALDLTFLDQAPIRFMNDVDIDLMEAKVIEVLEQAADGESRDWRNEDTSHSGSVKAVASFDKDGMACRRIELSSRVAKATHGGGNTTLEMCKVGSDWKILSYPR